MRSTGRRPVAEFVNLRGGLIVPVEALALLLRLESEEYTVRVSGSSLIVNPRGRMDAALKADVLKHKRNLLRLIRYVEARRR